MWPGWDSNSQPLGYSQITNLTRLRYRSQLLIVVRITSYHMLSKAKLKFMTSLCMTHERGFLDVSRVTFAGRPGARNFPGWSWWKVIAWKPGNIFHRLEFFKNRQFFFNLCVFLRISTFLSCFSMKYRDFTVKSKPIILLFQTMKIRLLDFHSLGLLFFSYILLTLG